MGYTEALIFDRLCPSEEISLARPEPDCFFWRIVSMSLANELELMDYVRARLEPSHSRVHIGSTLTESLHLKG